MVWCLYSPISLGSPRSKEGIDLFLPQVSLFAGFGVFPTAVDFSHDLAVHLLPLLLLVVNTSCVGLPSRKVKLKIELVHLLVLFRCCPVMVRDGGGKRVYTCPKATIQHFHKSTIAAGIQLQDKRPKSIKTNLTKRPLHLDQKLEEQGKATCQDPAQEGPGPGQPTPWPGRPTCSGGALGASFYEVGSTCN
ncbi:hypothetical protein EJB05_50238, partial [Eragrostis curvula]